MAEMGRLNLRNLFFLVFFGTLSSTKAVEVVGLKGVCETVELKQPLAVFRDPTFLSFFKASQSSSLQREQSLDLQPVIGKFSGAVSWIRHERPVAVRGFFEWADYMMAVNASLSRYLGLDLLDSSEDVLIYPIQFCGGAYQDTLGFVLKEQLEAALVAQNEGTSTPPSVLSIPKISPSQPLKALP